MSATLLVCAILTFAIYWTVGTQEWSKLFYRLRASIVYGMAITLAIFGQYILMESYFDVEKFRVKMSEASFKGFVDEMSGIYSMICALVLAYRYREEFKSWARKFSKQ